jgi:hypothetical protein
MDMKRTNYYFGISLLLIAVTLLNACKKEQAASGPSIQQKWKVIKSDYPSLKYVTGFGNNHFWLLNEDVNFLSHEKTNVLYKQDGDLLTAQFGSQLNHYREKFSGDTLFLLTNENNILDNNNIWLLKDNSAPSPEEWVVEVSGIDLMNSVSSGPMCWTVNNLTVLASGKALKLNLNNQTVETAVNLPSSYYGIEHTGSEWWVAEWDKLDRVNPSTGVINFVSAVAPANIRAITYNGSNIVYCFSNSGTNQFYEYNTSSNTFNGGTDAPNVGIYDMAFKGGRIYAVTQDYIYRINPASYKVEKTYTLPCYFTESIATDGTDFYVYGWTYAGVRKYFKVTLN